MLKGKKFVNFTKDVVTTDVEKYMPKVYFEDYAPKSKAFYKQFKNKVKTYNKKVTKAKKRVKYIKKRMKKILKKMNAEDLKEYRSLEKELPKAKEKIKEAKLDLKGIKHQLKTKKKREFKNSGNLIAYLGRISRNRVNNDKQKDRDRHDNMTNLLLDAVEDFGKNATAYEENLVLAKRIFVNYMKKRDPDAKGAQGFWDYFKFGGRVRRFSRANVRKRRFSRSRTRRFNRRRRFSGKKRRFSRRRKRDFW